jgi:hypothetical protein
MLWSLSTRFLTNAISKTAPRIPVVLTMGGIGAQPFRLPEAKKY